VTFTLFSTVVHVF